MHITSLEKDPLPILQHPLPEKAMDFLIGMSAFEACQQVILLAPLPNLLAGGVTTSPAFFPEASFRCLCASLRQSKHQSARLPASCLT